MSSPLPAIQEAQDEDENTENQGARVMGNESSFEDDSSSQNTQSHHDQEDYRFEEIVNVS